MAVPVFVIKAGLLVAQEVHKRKPNLWWQLPLAFVLVIALSVGMFVMFLFATVEPLLRNDGSEMSCSVNFTDGSGTEDPHNSGSGGGGEFSTSSTPWPTTDSSKVVYPVPNPVLTSPWGYRAPILVNGQLTPTYHNGLDFGQAMGTPVLSMADGVVAGAYGGNSLYGSHVAIKHRIDGDLYTSVYGHIIGSSITVKKGDVVKAGQQVAKIGSEGMSTAPHLHFVLTRGDYSAQSSEPGYTGAEGNTIDPKSFLAAKSAGEASGGVGRDDFSGVEGDEDLLCSGGVEYEGDGFTSWGGYSNGEIPSNLLTTIAFAEDKKLLAKAARDLEALNAQFHGKFGKNLRVIRAYEDIATGGGKSPYGFARSVKLDLAFGTPEYEWMTANATKKGWGQPSTFKASGASADAGMWGWKGIQDDVPPAATPDAEKARSYAEGLVKGQYGWGDPDYRCLVKLWERESNWNPLADNPTSDAYGIPQSLPGEKMASEGSDWKTNPETQIRWGLRYIKERYGTPCEAWGHSEQVGWY